VRVAAAGLREVRHEFRAQGQLDTLEHFLLHRFHAQEAVHDVEREFLRQDREHARGVFRADLRENDGNGLRILVLEIAREHFFLHVRELFPHVAAGGAANFFHDEIDAVVRQEFRKQTLGRDRVAHQRAGRRKLADEIHQELFDLFGLDRP